MTNIGAVMGFEVGKIGALSDCEGDPKIFDTGHWRAGNSVRLPLGGRLRTPLDPPFGDDR